MGIEDIKIDDNMTFPKHHDLKFLSGKKFWAHETYWNTFRNLKCGNFEEEWIILTNHGWRFVKFGKGSWYHPKQRGEKHMIKSFIKIEHLRDFSKDVKDKIESVFLG